MSFLNKEQYKVLTALSVVADYCDSSRAEIRKLTQETVDLKAENEKLKAENKTFKDFVEQNFVNDEGVLRPKSKIILPMS